MRLKGKVPFLLFALGLAAFAVGCSDPQPTRNVIVVDETTPTVAPTATQVIPPTPVATALPSTAVPRPGVTPTELAPLSPTVVPPLDPIDEVNDHPEPVANPIEDTPGPRHTIAPAETPTPQPTATEPPPRSEASVVIDCVFFDGLAPTSEADEYVQISNQGAAAVELSGWRLLDQSDGTPEFT